MYKLCFRFTYIQFNLIVHDLYHCCSKKLLTSKPGEKVLTSCFEFLLQKQGGNYMIP